MSDQRSCSWVGPRGDVIGGGWCDDDDDVAVGVTMQTSLMWLTMMLQQPGTQVKGKNEQLSVAL